MIGQVTAHHALLNVKFRLREQPDLEIACVIDTGFAGYLTLPMAAVLAMKLPFIRRMPVKVEKGDMYHWLVRRLVRRIFESLSRGDFICS